VLREGGDQYGKTQLSDYRALLDGLRQTGAGVPEVDRLIAEADALLATF
jgi:hypothetical protein